MTTKLVALCDALGQRMRFRLLPGQRYDAVAVAELLDGVAVGAPIADQSYDADRIVAAVQARTAEVVIAQHRRRAQPLAIDRAKYAWRHLVENFFCRLKEFKRIARRADKLDRTFAAIIALAAPVLRPDEPQRALAGHRVAARCGRRAAPPHHRRHRGGGPAMHPRPHRASRGIRRLCALAALIGALTAAPAAAQEPGAATLGPLSIADAYARASLGRAPNSAAYMTLSTSGAADRLVAAATPAAERVELHTHSMDDQGVMRMRPVDGIDVGQDAPAALQPGGLHLMLVGVKGRLEAGATIPLTLTFENAGEVTLEVPVRALRSEAGGHAGHGSSN